MRIGIIIGRIGGVDGVALETEKWIDVIEGLGHVVYVLTGSLKGDIKRTTVIPEMDFHNPQVIREQDQAFFRQNVQEVPLIARLEVAADHIEIQITRWIIQNKLDVIVPQNASALPCHLAMGMAIAAVLEKTQIPCVAHHHDFYWERGDRYKSRFPEIRRICRENFPPRLPNINHVVINTYNQQELKRRFGIDATVVPNVMDFDTSYGQSKRYVPRLRKALGVAKDDILLLQVTRIVKRKGIETAIQLVKQLDNPKIKLVITGTAADDFIGYYDFLTALTRDLGLDDQVLFAGHLFDNYRKNGKKGGKQIFSLEDAYAAADACTYFSTYEGFGNAFVEAVLSKTPIFVNNYKPVYWPDIGSKGFDTVMIENGRLPKRAVEEIATLLADRKRQDFISEKNFKLGKKYFSYQVLAQILKKLF